MDKPVKPLSEHVEPDSGGQKQTITDRLLELARAKCSLFVDGEGVAYATFPSSHNVYETWPVNSQHFGRLIGSWYYHSYKKPVKSESKREVCEILAGFAYEEGRTEDVFLRVGTCQGKHYIDLCNDHWQVIEVSPLGWRVLDQSPVKFIRSRTMKALPTPVEGGDINQLWQFINVAERDRLLVLAWLIECFRENTQNPVLEVLGGHGTGKSTTLEVLRSMVDPNSALLRSMPRNEDDLFVSAQSNWILTYENVSLLSDSQQDVICQISTGSAYAKRALYSDADETVLQARRPQVINGITPLATRQDLIDRCVSIELPKFEPVRRAQKSELDALFAKAQAKLLGALFQIMAAALKLLPDTKLKELPRMADFGLLGTAIGVAVNHPVPFMQLFSANQKTLALSGIESSPVASALLELCKKREGGLVFDGIYADLLKQLDVFRAGHEGWPKSAKGFANLLKRQAPALALQGVSIESHGRSSQGSRVRVQYKTCNQSTQRTQHTPYDSENVDSVRCVRSCKVETGDDQLKRVTI
ncbi:hypothetical protein NX722_24285 [Endozoicomonas gorgoniicola]|uniref:ATP-binding protein n=1 Tax=Endozoicomonas gorgoniicola TaxID=1234144 RepID=A0ABT3N3A3_9GAMM|nr:hypothetical protein [Endozoicomonas gorgoniicola]MCW7555689.1 hypothetical protein [Endozoicomonas gorgoniicola]